MGVRTLVYYFGTTFMAIIVGVILVVTIHPGERDLKDELAVSNVDSRVSSLDAFLDLFRSVNNLCIVLNILYICVVSAGIYCCLCVVSAGLYHSLSINSACLYHSLSRSQCMSLPFPQQ